MLRAAVSVLFALTLFVSVHSAWAANSPQTVTTPADENAAATKPDASRRSNARVLFITTSECPRCEEELARLRKPGGEFDKLRAQGWKIGETEDSHLQIVDAGEIEELVDRLAVREFPTVAGLEHGEIVRCFRSGCTTPLDRWTFGFLAKGIDERPPGSVLEAARVATTGHYRLRGNHWSVDDDWSPSREKTLGHLRGPHGHQILASYKIESWSLEELRSLHDDLHEREMGGVSFSSARYQPAGSQFSATRKAGGR
jgi:hypothetical protein